MKRSSFLKNIVAGIAAVVIAPKLFAAEEPKDVYPANAKKGAYHVISGYDLYDRDFRKKLMARVPRYHALRWMKALKGKGRVQKAVTYKFFEE